MHHQSSRLSTRIANSKETGTKNPERCGALEYECDRCDAIFHHRRNMTMHYRICHKLFRNDCRNCGVFYSSKNATCFTCTIQTDTHANEEQKVDISLLDWNQPSKSVASADVMQTEINGTISQNHGLKIEQPWETEPNVESSTQSNIHNITPTISDVTCKDGSSIYESSHINVGQSGMKTMCSRIKETREIDSTISTQITGFRAGGYNITAYTCKVCSRLFPYKSHLTRHMAKYHHANISTVNTKIKCTDEVQGDIKTLSTSVKSPIETDYPDTMETACSMVIENKLKEEPSTSCMEFRVHYQGGHEITHTSNINVRYVNFDRKGVRFYKCMFCLSIYYRANGLAGHYRREHKVVSVPSRQFWDRRR